MIGLVAPLRADDIFGGTHRDLTAQQSQRGPPRGGGPQLHGQGRRSHPGP
jgi:hypothetical protein